MCVGCAPSAAAKIRSTGKCCCWKNKVGDGRDRKAENTLQLKGEKEGGRLLFWQQKKKQRATVAKVSLGGGGGKVRRQLTMRIMKAATAAVGTGAGNKRGQGAYWVPGTLLQCRHWTTAAVDWGSRMSRSQRRRAKTVKCYSVYIDDRSGRRTHNGVIRRPDLLSVRRTQAQLYLYEQLSERPLVSARLFLFVPWFWNIHTHTLTLTLVLRSVVRIMELLRQRPLFVAAVILVGMAKCQFE